MKLKKKKNLSDKIISPISIRSGSILDVKDVKVSIKYFIESFENGLRSKLWAKNKTKEIFGEKIIGGD